MRGVFESAVVANLQYSLGGEFHAGAIDGLRGGDAMEALETGI